MKPVYYTLSEHLALKAKNIANQRSAEHRILLILAATSELVGERDYHEIRIPDICKICSISRATFYLHFQSRDEVFAELMRCLVELETDLSPSVADCPNIAEAIERIVDWYIEVHLANASLFLNLAFLRRTNMDINQSWLKRADILHQRISDNLSIFPEFQALDSDTDFIVEFMGGGMNGVLTRINSDLPKNPFIPKKLSILKKSVSKIFYRSLLGKDLDDKL